MKKIFTLCAVAMAAMSMNAQDVISASQKEVFDLIVDAYNHPTDNANVNFILVTAEQKVYPAGTNDAKAADVKLADGGNITLHNCNWTATKGNLTVTGVSTLNADGNPATEAWQVNTYSKNQFLTATDTMYYKPKTGNPSLGYKDFYEYKEGSTETVHRVYEEPWKTDCGQVPLKGCYYKVTSAVDGTVSFGFMISQVGKKNLYIVDGSTCKLVDYSKLKVKGFRQNNNYEKEKGNTTNTGEFLDLTISADGIINHANWGADISRNFLGYVSFPVKANTDYYVFSPSYQLGFYSARIGEIPEPTITAISTVQAENAEAVAPVKRIENGRILIGNYNLAGQRVK